MKRVKKDLQLTFYGPAGVSFFLFLINFNKDLSQYKIHSHKKGYSFVFDIYFKIRPYKNTYFHLTSTCFIHLKCFINCSMFTGVLSQSEMQKKQVLQKSSKIFEKHVQFLALCLKLYKNELLLCFFFKDFGYILSKVLIVCKISRTTTSVTVNLIQPFIIHLSSV